MTCLQISKALSLLYFILDGIDWKVPQKVSVGENWKKEMQELFLTIVDHVWMRLSIRYIFRLYPDEHGKLPFPKRDLINQTTWNCPDNKQQEEGREAQIARNRDRQSRDKDRRTVRESLYVLSRGDSPDQFHFIPMFCCNVPPSAWHFWVRKCLLQAPIVMFHTNSH